ncbi:MAG: hypothetical protein WCP79_04950 [Bacillota bacterium]
MNTTAFLIALVIALGYYFSKTRVEKRRQAEQNETDKNETTIAK